MFFSSAAAFAYTLALTSSYSFALSPSTFQALSPQRPILIRGTSSKYRTVASPFINTTYSSSSLFLASSEPTGTTATDTNTNPTFSPFQMKVVTLARYPIKGLAPDLLSGVRITCDDFIPTFPDDRRFALLQQKKKDDGESTEAGTAAKFDPGNPKWIHKEHFLCAFTEPEFMAKFNCEYKIISAASNDGDGGIAVDQTTETGEEEEKAGNSSPLYSYCLPNDHVIPMNKSQSIQRMLTIYQRKYNSSPLESESSSPKILLGPIDLSTSNGNQELEHFFMKQYEMQQKKKDEDEIEGINPTPSSPILKCASAGTDTQGQGQHVHQFGNTRSGVKLNNNDTRTIHIINAETVKELSSKIGIDINPMRFRPNLVVSGLEPWKEFDFVGKTLKVISSHGNNVNHDDSKGGSSDNNDRNGMTIEVLSTTVRCAGVGIDPNEHPTKQNKLDIPILLNQHYPQFGPYLGVYATIRTAGSIYIGDTMELIVEEAEE